VVPAVSLGSTMTIFSKAIHSWGHSMRRSGAEIRWSPTFVNKCILLVVAFIARTASCDLWGIDYSGDVYKINPATGLATFSSTTSIAGTNSLAVNAAGVVFTVGVPKDPPFGVPSALYTLNPVSGGTTLVATLTPLTDCRALAFAPDGTLYAISHRLTDDAHELVKINLTSGAVSVIGPTHFNLIQALDFSPSGLLYGWDVSRGMMRLNTLTGAATDIAPSTLGNTIGIQSIAFDGSGVLYGGVSSLYRLSTSSDAAVLIGDLNPGSFMDIRGIAFAVPEPATWTLVFVASSIFVVRRKPSFRNCG